MSSSAKVISGASGGSDDCRIFEIASNIRMARGEL